MIRGIRLFLVAGTVLVFLSGSLLLAGDIDLNELGKKIDPEKAKQLFNQYKDKLKTSTDSSSGSDAGSSGQGNVGTTGIAEPASVGDIDQGPAKVDPNDQRFCEGHMKLAKRHFKGNNLDRAKEEIKIVLERISDFPEARFMRAVIAAREKDFPEAWRNIVVAEKAAPTNTKIKEFVERLQKAFPKPQNLDTSGGGSRPAPEFASQFALDAIEGLLQDKALSKVNGFSLSDFSEDSGKVFVKIAFQGTAAMEGPAIEAAVKGNFKGEIKDLSTGSDSKKIEMKAEIPGMPKQNGKVKAISGIGDFLKSVSEETDVAIKNSSESEPDGDARVTGTYSIIAASIKNLNNFLRKASPYAIEYSIPSVAISDFNGKSVWKGDLKILFQGEKK